MQRCRSCWGAAQYEKLSVLKRDHAVWALNKQLERTEAIRVALKATPRDDDVAIKTDAATTLVEHQALA